MFKHLFCGSSLFVLALASGCSTKGSTTPATDGSGGSGNEPCGGHGQPACKDDAGMPDYLNHEGGEIRLEFLETNTGQQSVILYAWFLNGQAPEKLPQPGSGCTNVLSYANTTNPGAEINDSRAYMDVGNTVSLTGPGGTISLQKYENIADKRGLVMDVGYAKDGSVRNTVTPSTMLRGGEYSVSLGNGMPFPGKVKLPTQWETIGGTLAFGPNVVNNIPKDTNVIWDYSYIPDEPYVQYGILLFTGTNTSGVRETWFCVNEVTGRVALDAATVAQFPPSGTLQAATIAHQQIGFNGRNVDVLGITCRQTPYTIQ
jgi:hypothetical protein